MSRKKNCRKHKNDGLVSKVWKFTPKGENRDYIPYCDFHYHRGIVMDRSVCESRNCKYYRRLYIKDGEKLR